MRVYLKSAVLFCLFLPALHEMLWIMALWIYGYIQMKLYSVHVWYIANWWCLYFFYVVEFTTAKKNQKKTQTHFSNDAWLRLVSLCVYCECNVHLKKAAWEKVSTDFHVFQLHLCNEKWIIILQYKVTCFLSCIWQFVIWKCTQYKKKWCMTQHIWN